MSKRLTPERSAELDRQITARYPLEGPKLLAAEYGVSPATIAGRAHRKGITTSGGPQRMAATRADRHGSNQPEPGWSDRLNEAIRTRYKSEGAEVLAKEFNTNYNLVKRRALLMGIRRTPVRRDAVRDAQINQQIKTRYETEGQTLAASLGLSEAALNHRARRRNLKSKTRYQRGANTKADQNSSVNVAYFDTLTPESAYILGYIYADGGIIDRTYVLSFTCQLRDRHLLRNVRNAMSSTHRIAPKEKIHESGKRAIQASLQISSKRIIDALHLLGVKQNKSNLNLPLPVIPTELYPHFIRGFFDGDGSVFTAPSGVTALKLLGTIQFITEMTDLIVSTLNVKPKQPKRSTKRCKSVYAVVWAAKADVTKIRDWLYKDATIFLPRKKQKLDLVPYPSTP